MVTLAERLIDDLDGDLAKRRRELIDLRLLVASASGSRLDLLSRACQVMAYAHWEGFVKYALQRYLAYIARLSPKVGDLRYQLQGLYLREEIRRAVAPERDVSDLAGLLPQLGARTQDVFLIEPTEVIRSGNLTSDNLRTLLGCAGLDYTAAYEAREKYIDSVVCGRRHRVAHGGWQPITATEARELVSDVLDLCEEVNGQIQTAVVYERYRL